MLNLIWSFFIIGGFVFSYFNDNVEDVTQALFDSADQAVSLAVGLISIMTFWLGIMKIIEKSGLIQLINKALTPFAKLLFPTVPKDHPAMNAILMNMSANILGMGSAATPFGIRAMEELQKLNKNPDTASNAMCTFLAVNTSSLTLIPTAIIGIRSAAGAVEPAEIVGTTIIATYCSSFIAITVDKIIQKITSP